MKKLITILIFVLCGITTAAMADESAESWDSYDRGDMNCDQQINVLDAVALVASILNNVPQDPCGVNVDTVCESCDDPTDSCGPGTEWVESDPVSLPCLGLPFGGGGCDDITINLGDWCVPTAAHDAEVFDAGADSVSCNPGASYCGDGAAWLPIVDIDDADDMSGAGASIILDPTVILSLYSCQPTDSHNDTVYETGYDDGVAAVNACEGPDVQWAWANDPVIYLPELMTSGAGAADFPGLIPGLGSYQCVPTDDALEASYNSGAQSVTACDGDDVAAVWHGLGPIFEVAGSGASEVPFLPAPVGYYTCEPTDDFEDTTYWSGYDDGKAEGIDACPACGDANACGVTSLYEDDCGVCGGPGLNDDGCCGDETMDCHGDCGGQGVEDECGVCDGDGSSCATGPDCTDDPAWESTYGSCSSYSMGLENHLYCAEDIGDDGVLAAEACPAACAAPGDDCWVDPGCQYGHIDDYVFSGTCVESLACCGLVMGVVFGGGNLCEVQVPPWADVSMCQ